jgi:hypothetical protein
LLIAYVRGFLGPERLRSGEQSRVSLRHLCILRFQGCIGTNGSLDGGARSAAIERLRTR